MNLLTRKRLTVYSWSLIVIYAVTACYTVAMQPGLLDIRRQPKGGDFVTFYAASVLAREGKPTLAYEPRTVFALEKQITNAPDYTTTWDYPPPFLLAVLPLSSFPYLAALAVWLAITLWGYVIAVRRFAPHPPTTRLLIAFPGVFQNAIQGQNGFLTTALLGSGLFLLDTKPLWGGAILGLLSYKPHLAWLAVVALLAGRRWTALAAAAASAAALALVSLAVFHVETWSAFLTNIPVHGSMLACGAFPTAKMPTTFAAVRLLGGSVSCAYCVQSAVALSAGASVVLLWRKAGSANLRIASLVIATCLAFPFIFDYDLVILAVALVCIVREARKEGWMRGEQVVLILGWFSPFIATILAQYTRVQVGPLIFGLLMAVVLRRAALLRWRSATPAFSREAASVGQIP